MGTADPGREERRAGWLQSDDPCRAPRGLERPRDADQHPCHPNSPAEGVDLGASLTKQLAADAGVTVE
jgi:hypothetical protein